MFSSVATAGRFILVSLAATPRDSFAAQPSRRSRRGPWRVRRAARPGRSVAPPKGGRLMPAPGAETRIRGSARRVAGVRRIDRAVAAAPERRILVDARTRELHDDRAIHARCRRPAGSFLPGEREPHGARHLARALRLATLAGTGGRLLVETGAPVHALRCYVARFHLVNPQRLWRALPHPWFHGVGAKRLRTARAPVRRGRRSRHDGVAH